MKKIQKSIIKIPLGINYNHSLTEQTNRQSINKHLPIQISHSKRQPLQYTQRTSNRHRVNILLYLTKYQPLF